MQVEFLPIRFLKDDGGAGEVASGPTQSDVHQERIIGAIHPFEPMGTDSRMCRHCGLTKQSHTRSFKKDQTGFDTPFHMPLNTSPAPSALQMEEEQENNNPDTTHQYQKPPSPLLWRFMSPDDESSYFSTPDGQTHNPLHADVLSEDEAAELARQTLSAFHEPLDTPSSNVSKEATRSKPSVHYRKGSALRDCGNCDMSHLHGGVGTCDLVKGRISADDVCDEWEAKTVTKRGPWGQESGQTGEWVSPKGGNFVPQGQLTTEEYLRPQNQDSRAASAENRAEGPTFGPDNPGLDPATQIDAASRMSSPNVPVPREDRKHFYSQCPQCGVALNGTESACPNEWCGHDVSHDNTASYDHWAITGGVSR